MEICQMQSIHSQQQYPADAFRDPAEKAASIRSGHLHSQPNANGHGYGYGYPPPLTPGTPAIHHSQEALTAPGPNAASSGSLNIKRGFAIGGLVAIFILFTTVIGLAAGLGMTQENLRQARNDLAIAQGKLGGSAADATNPSPTTAPTPTASAAPTATAQAVQCPAGNGTFYTATTAFKNKQFQRICGIDYGKGEANDISNRKAANLDQCMDLCAANANCTGAGWGQVGGSEGSLQPCWMKNGLKSPHVATPDWGFGIFIKELD